MTELGGFGLQHGLLATAIQHYRGVCISLVWYRSSERGFVRSWGRQSLDFEIIGHFEFSYFEEGYLPDLVYEFKLNVSAGARDLNFLVEALYLELDSSANSHLCRTSWGCTSLVLELLSVGTLKHFELSE